MLHDMLSGQYHNTPTNAPIPHFMTIGLTGRIGISSLDAAQPGFFYPTVWTEPPAPGSG